MRFRITSILASIFTVGLLGSPVIAQADKPLMPDGVDQIYLAWVNGPPQLQAFLPEDEHLAGFREEHALLGLRSGQWGMVLDPRKLEITHLTHKSTDASVEDLLDFEQIQKAWATAKLKLEVGHRDQVYRPKGGPLPSIKEDYKYSPIHIVESGEWFQHIAIYDLVLENDGGETLEADTWIEIRAWGDQLLVEWFVHPKVKGLTKLYLDFEAEGIERSVISHAGSVQLSIVFEDDKLLEIPDQAGVEMAVSAREGFSDLQPSVNYSKRTDAWELQIPRQDWDNPTGAAYPEALLDRVSKFDLTLRNTSDHVREVRLRMLHDYHPLTGYVPMLLDADGQHTGLPIQNSKNWHVLKKEPFPYEGSWINQTARLKLEPNSEVELRYEVVHALWQGLPASSVAQLSLVGWGFNGFWTQMALGAWGESICIQPGRTMRRSYITDVRPFMVRSMYDMNYDWTANMGGADLLKVVDADGKYIPWVGSITDYKMIGPNLSHVEVVERSSDDRLRVKIDTYLPISNSINRSYFKVRMDVLEDLDLSELTLMQLGADYYNDANSSKVAWGNADQLIKELQPKKKERGNKEEQPMQLAAKDSWLCLFGNISPHKNVGQGVRGVVLRNFTAKLGEQEYDSAWAQAIWSGNQSLGAELQLAPDTTKLTAGDYIEFDFEFLILPITAESYFGPDAALKERLAADEDNWPLVAHEVTHQKLFVNGEEAGYPAVLESSAINGQIIEVESAGTLNVLLVTGLPDAGATWGFYELQGEEISAMGARYKVEANPQVDFDPKSGTWTAVFCIQFEDTCRKRQFKLELQ